MEADQGGGREAGRDGQGGGGAAAQQRCGRRRRRWPGVRTGSSRTRKGTPPARMWVGGRRPEKGQGGRRGGWEGEGVAAKGGGAGGRRSRGGAAASQPQPRADADGLGLGVATTARVCAAPGTEGARDGRGMDGGGSGGAGSLHEPGGENEGKAGEAGDPPLQ